jgi:hypothetical protein
MSDWLTYHLQDFLLFSARTYYRLFERYNREVWPLHVAALAIGALILFRLLRGRAMAMTLAAIWLWVAWAFHWKRYSTIQIAAKWFAVLFVIEALLFVWLGVVRDRFRPSAGRRLTRQTGIALFVFALFAQPLIGVLAGRSWMSIEIFGIAPDPTVVATLGIVLFARDRVRESLLIVPLLWCGISGATLWTLHAPDAFVLPVAALVAVIAALIEKSAVSPDC